MLEFIAGRIIALIEYELEKHGDEIEHAILEQIEHLGIVIKDFVQSKLCDEPDKLEHENGEANDEGA